MAGTVVASTINNDTGLFSTNNAYLGIAKAWVNFNATTGAVNGSMNISSVTVNSTSNWLVNFTTAMPSVNYSVASTLQFANTVNVGYTAIGVVGAATTSNFYLFGVNSSSGGNATGMTYIYCTIFSS